MQETIVGDRKNPYHYVSFINDINARDLKYKELKAKGYKEIKIGQYICATGETIFCNLEIMNDDYKEVQELMYKYDKKLYNKCKKGYLVIRGSWSGYSGQSNCDRGERWSWCKKMTQMSYCKAQYNKNYVQTFSDGTENYRTINFEYDKPEVNNNLGGYEWRLRKQGLPV